MVRFELTLKHARLKELYGIGDTLALKELPDLLCQVTDDGPMLLDKYIVQTLFPGAMLSLCVLKRYLRRENGSKEHRTKKMLDYSKWVTKMSPDCCNLYGTSTQISNRKDHFQALSLSPVYVNGECPYIPSFSDMLNGTVDQRLLNFAWQATKYKQKDLTYWIFGQQDNS